VSRRGKGEGSVYRRESDGRWVGVLDLGWIDGRRRRRVVYGSTRADVVGRLRELERRRRHGVNLAATTHTVGSWLDEWLNAFKAHDGTRPSTLARYRQVVETHLRPGLGRIRLDRLAPWDVQAFLTRCRASVSPGTVGKIHAVLRAALADAERMDLVVRNVAKSVRVRAAQPREQRVLSIEEARRLLGAVRDDRLEGVFVLGLTLGLRRGEVLGLKWNDFDPVAGTLRVERAVQRTGGRLVVVEPKTPRSKRLLPVPGLTAAAIERQRARQARDRLRAGSTWHDLGFMFATSLGTPLEPRNVNRRFNELRTELGMADLRLHDLRHACATLLLASGVEPRTVMEILGHSTYRLTMDLYGHGLPERMTAAAVVMDRTLGF
jgi:integrase